ncbi:hypothetical protein SDC9_202632 [bioreactor metagenome]|uniref:Uncharacterized protein n=1 Tax=bioreactor metagenome TaxID=1076179 RepID=A0A645J658_9ZZZZ
MSILFKVPKGLKGNVVKIHSSPRYCDNDENLELWRALTPLVKWEGEVSRVILSQETCLKVHDLSGVREIL